ncbi:RNA polymerase sigma factor [Thermodesulfobacteriota bacterium]
MSLQMDLKAVETDEELAFRAGQGSQSHFSALVDRHTGLVYRVAFRITGSHMEAEDVVQETFLRAFKAVDRFDPAKGGFRTWLLAIARNQSINTFNTLKRKALRFFGDRAGDRNDSSSEEVLISTQQGVEDQLAAKQELLAVQTALMDLPERQRTALMLKVDEDMSYSEIARIMKTSTSSVESLIFRARQQLLKRMQGRR